VVLEEGGEVVPAAIANIVQEGIENLVFLERALLNNNPVLEDLEREVPSDLTRLGQNRVHAS